MMRILVFRKHWKWSLLLTSTVFGILPGGCEETLLRAVTPLLI